MSLHKQLGRWLFNQTPPYNKTFNHICQRYVDRYNGDNNCDPSTNGEELLLRTELSKLRGRGGVVFDVGSNVGDWAKYALDVEPSIQLHCFEPTRATFDQLSANQWPDNVHLNNLGLGEADGQLELNIVGTSSAMNSVYVRHGVESAQSISKETISITTADAYCEHKCIDHIHFFKADVEGHELAVFKGMKRMLSEGRVHLIQFEYGGCNLDAKVSLGDILDFLAPYGFQFYKLYPEGPRRIETYQQCLETFKYSNWAAIHD